MQTQVPCVLGFIGYDIEATSSFSGILFPWQVLQHFQSVRVHAKHTLFRQALTVTADLYLVVSSSHELYVTVWEPPCQIPGEVYPLSFDKGIGNELFICQFLIVQIAPCKTISPDAEFPNDPYRDRKFAWVKDVDLSIINRYTYRYVGTFYLIG